MMSDSTLPMRVCAKARSVPIGYSAADHRGACPYSGRVDQLNQQSGGRFWARLSGQCADDRKRCKCRCSRVRRSAAGCRGLRGETPSILRWSHSATVGKLRLHQQLDRRFAWAKLNTAQFHCSGAAQPAFHRGDSKFSFGHHHWVARHV